MAVSKTIHVVVSRSLGGLSYLPGRKVVLPDRIEAIATSPSWRADVTVTIAVEDGSALVDEVRIHRHPGAESITASTLRAIPVATIARHAVDVAAMPAHFDGGRLSIQLLGSDGLTGAGSAEPDEVPRRRARLSPEQRNDLLRKVASAYRESLTLSENPRPAVHVAKSLGYSSSHARKLIHEARTEGILGPAPGPGRVGEVSPDTKEQS